MSDSRQKSAGRAYILAVAGLLQANVLGLWPLDIAAREKAPRTQKQLEQKLALVERVLFRSPLGEAAANGPDRLDADVYEAWVAAGLAFELAVEAMERENRDSADESLDSALAYYRKAAALNRQTSSAQRDYSHELDVVKGRVHGYVESLERIHSEKGTTPSGSAGRWKIDEAMAAAQRYEDEGEPVKALQVLTALQLALEGELVSARSGETLVSSVVFENPDEAFEYEIRRSSSNEKLLELLFSNEAVSEDRRKLAHSYLEESRKASERAMTIREQGDVEEALQALEAATAAQTRALRLLGVDI
jgi:microcompartment protein CcmL/EutN